MTYKGVDKKGGERPRVLALDGVDEAGIDVLNSVADVEVRKTISQDELHKILPDFEALIVRSATTVTEALIKHGTKLRVIGRAGVGIDNICVKAATARGIYVVNSPQGNTIAAAELALTFILALSRRLVSADNSVSNGKWERSKFQGTQVHGKTIGIVGLGQVGSYIARICASMEMEVLAYDPFVNQAKATSLGVSIVSFKELLQKSDIVTLHVPLIESTRNLIREETLAFMKPHALLINTSRGGVVDEAAVAAALTEGRLGGAALDVYCVEGCMQPQNPLLVAKKQGVNLILTPHIGASTCEAQVNVSLDVAQQIKHILQGELPKSAVNLPGVRINDMPRAARYISHAETLGRLCSQLLPHSMERIHLKVAGDIENDQLDVLLLATAQGVLATHCEHRINFVNVRQMAVEHKLDLSVSKAYGHRSTLYLEVSVHSSTESASIGGCSTSEGTLILRMFKGMPIAFCMPQINPVSPFSSFVFAPTAAEAATAAAAATAATAAAAGARSVKEADFSAGGPEETAGDKDERPIYMFYTLHLDRPGVLASILSVISAEGVNVANCHLGRRNLMNHKEDEEAPRAPAAAAGGPQELLGMCIFHTDSVVNETLLERIRNLKFVREAKLFATPRTLGQTSFV